MNAGGIVVVGITLPSLEDWSRSVSNKISTYRESVARLLGSKAILSINLAEKVFLKGAYKQHLD